MRNTAQTTLVISASGSKASRGRTILLCMLAVLMDGYDTAAVGFAAPAMAREWGLASSAFTPAFVGTSIGAVLGFLSAGWLARRCGHRFVIVMSLLWFGASSLATVWADSILALAAIRFVTALGLGVAVPAAIALATEHSKREHREVVATLVAMGFGLGVVIGGIASQPLLARYEWSSIFVAGGAAPLLTSLLFWLWLPTSGAAPAGPQHRASIPALLQEGLLSATLLLWTFAFLIFMNTYMFTFWTPLLLSSLGYSAADAAIGPTAFGAGGLLGGMLAMPAIARLGVTRVLTITSLIGAASVAILGLADLSYAWILILLAGAGTGLAFGNIGHSAAAVSIYGPQLCATGIGCAAAIGRIGGIIGPAAAGALLYLDWPVQSILLTACAPCLLAAGAMLALARRKGAAG